MEKFRASLIKHAKYVIDFEKRMLPLTKHEIKSHQDTKVWYICGKIILKKLSKSIIYSKVRDQCHYPGKYIGAAHSIGNSKFNVPHEIPVTFHNSSNYDSHFIVRELAN